MEEVRRILKFDSCLIVESVGYCGGFALKWKSEWSVRICNYTRWHISATIQEGKNGPIWMFMGFYGNPNTSKRDDSWERLKYLKPLSSMAWLCTGDFDEITCQSEKVGVAYRPYKQMESFI